MLMGSESQGAGRKLQGRKVVYFSKIFCVLEVRGGASRELERAVEIVQW